MREYANEVLSAKEMAEFIMRPSHLREYQAMAFRFVKENYSQKYSDDVRKFAVEINSKRKK